MTKRIDPAQLPDAQDLDLWSELVEPNDTRSAACAKMGMSSDTVTRVRNGSRNLTLTERLAMAAIRAGLRPWSPMDDQKVADMATLTDVLGRLSSAPSNSQTPDPASAEDAAARRSSPRRRGSK